MIETIKQLLLGVPYRLLVAAVVFFLGLILGKAAGRLTERGLKEIELNSLLKKIGIKWNIEKIISNILSSIIYLAAFIFALENIGLSSVMIYMISFALIAMILLSFFVAIRDFFPNMMAGLFVLKKSYISVGHKLEVDGLKGTVSKINLTHTEVITKKGDTILIPNSIISKKTIIISK